METTFAPDITQRIRKIVKTVPFDNVKPSAVVCMRSTQATSRARARIWSFPKIWQKALNLEPHYIIEVLSQHFDHLSNDDQTRVLIHELMHIPRNFSGALVPHRGRGRSIDSRSVEKLFKLYQDRK